MYRSLIASAFILFLTSSCIHSSGETWENFKTAGRYMQKGVDAMWGKDYESKMLTSSAEFIGPDDDEFIPLKDSDLQNQIAAGDRPIPQPKGMPGKKGVPSLGEFYTPSGSLHSLFFPVHFETDQHVVKNQSEVDALLKIAKHLKENPSLYLVVEGNCDERASASYNMALGMRRSNYVRSFLVKHGVDLNRIYTVSKGKENPVVFGHTASEWKLNRRCEFKIYER